jgi:hypothetical protein
VNKLQTAALTLLAAIAIAAAFRLNRLMHPGLFEPYHPAAVYIDVVVRGIVLFATGWTVAGAVYLISGRTLPREILAWTVVGVSVVAAVLARIG